MILSIIQIIHFYRQKTLHLIITYCTPQTSPKLVIHVRSDDVSHFGGKEQQHNLCICLLTVSNSRCCWRIRHAEFPLSTLNKHAHRPSWAYMFIGMGEIVIVWQTAANLMRMANVHTREHRSNSWPTQPINGLINKQQLQMQWTS